MEQIELPREKESAEVEEDTKPHPIIRKVAAWIAKWIAVYLNAVIVFIYGLAAAGIGIYFMFVPASNFPGIGSVIFGIVFVILGILMMIYGVTVFAYLEIEIH